MYGVLQERIMTIGFGPHSELFGNSVFLVLCNRLITCCCAASYVFLMETSMRPAAPLSNHACVSCYNVISSFCQYEALKYVSFAVQTLAKSAKTLPVMLWGTCSAGKRYKLSDYISAVTISLGCTVFVLGGPVTSRTAGDRVDNWELMAIGGVLMLLYLAVDGLTSTWQDSMFQSYHMSICNQVCGAKQGSLQGCIHQGRYLCVHAF